ncbi:MAG: hypothetical protein COA78_33550 [Blastopirellula sp.]|nr:MAG: hypothetical protein COA78_33550 [Blastopirellula sp.]
MQVEYTYTKESIKALFKVAPKGNLYWRTFSPFLSVICKAFTVICLFKLLDARGFLAIAMMLLLTYYIWELLRTTRKLAKSYIPDETHHARLTDDYYEDINSYDESRMAWSAIHQFIDSKSHLIILISPISAHVIPKAAFESLEEAQEFSDVIQKNIENANAKSNKILEPLTIANGFKPHWVTSVKRTFRFQLDRSQWARAELIGVGKASFKKRPRWSSIFRSLSVTLVAITFLILILSSITNEYSFYYYLSFYLLSVPTVILHAVNWFVFRIWCNNVLSLQLQPIEIQLSSEGIGIISDVHASWTKWSHIKTVGEDKELIALYSKSPIPHCLIPQASFNDPIEAANTFEMIQDLHILAKDQQADGDEDTSLINGPDTGNPYQTPEYE